MISSVIWCYFQNVVIRKPNRTLWTYSRTKQTSWFDHFNELVSATTLLLKNRWGVAFINPVLYIHTKTGKACTGNIKNIVSAFQKPSWICLYFWAGFPDKMTHMTLTRAQEFYLLYFCSVNRGSIWKSLPTLFL